MLSELTIKEFLEQVGSGDPVPGGGSVAALAAALSAGLSGMVARVTMGKRKDGTIDEQMTALIARAGELEKQLTGDIDKDSGAYSAVITAFRMAKGTEDEKDARQKAIQDAFTIAAKVPLSVAGAGVELLSLAKTVVVHGNPKAVTDGVVAALMARSAVLGALYNVRINLTSIKDKSLVAEMAGIARTLEKSAVELEGEILSRARSIMEKEA